MLEKIQNALQSFSGGNLTENALDFFRTLGYESERQLPFDNKSVEDFQDYITEDSKFSEKNAFVEEWKYVDLLFQLTESELKEQNLLSENDKSIDQRITSYLFFVIELNEDNYSRTKLSQITREANKVFEIPVMILFKYGELVTLAVIDRRPNKKDESKDVLRKVTLIKDIRFQNPHAAHRLILEDLSLLKIKSNSKFTINNFLDLHNAWRTILDTKELNKRFFKELANWYFWAVENVNFPDDDEKDEDVRNATSVIRLITRLMFVWFLKEKGLVSDKLFDENYLQTILKFKDESAYYKAILQNLFFATLNSEMNTRKFIAESSGGRNAQHFVHNVFRYKSEFIEPEETKKELFEPIPFLNGGLFECLDKETEIDGTKCRVRVDGFSDHPKNVLEIPDELFFGAEQEIDLNEIYGTKNKKYKVRGLVNILNSYKFTIAENTPIEEEIALDPELLGKVFENLLASYNPETKTTARKQTGSFYTPREIVNYMVDESLIAYLKAKLQTETEGFAGFVAMGENQPTMFGNEARIQQKFEMPVSNNRWHGKDEDLENALRDLFSYTETTNKFNETETEILIKAIDNCKILDPACGSGAFPMGILHRLVHLLKKLDIDNVKWREWQRQKAVKETEEAFKIGDHHERDERLKQISDIFENNASDYGRKLFLIENCIYGVDIQPIAIQIAKLRFFISLIVDEKTNAEKENLGIRPLPNLETKFVAANTLIGLEAQGGLKPTKVNELEKELKEVRAKHFSARTRKTKEKYRDKDKEIRQEIAELLKQGGIKADIADQIAEWNPYDQNASAEWFDAEYMFGIEKGFDIVIGNPPYVQVPKGIFSVSQFPYSEGKDKGKQNLYKVFVENSYNLAKHNGFATMIVQSSLMCDISAQFTRQLLLTKTELSNVIEFPKVAPTKEGQVFENVLQGTCVYTFKKAIPSKNQEFLLSINNDVTTVSNMKFDSLNQSNLLSIYPNGYFIPLVKSNEFNLAQIIFGKSELLKYKINKIKKGDISSDGGKNLFYGVTSGFRLIRGNNIQRFCLKYPFDNVRINNATENLAKQNSIEKVIAFQNITGTVDKHRIHCALFEDEDDLIFLDTTIKIFLKSSQNAKFFLGVLNCRILDWYFRKTSTNNHVNGYEIEQLPIPKATAAQQTEIAEIVDEIIEAKKLAPNADTKELERKIDRLVYALYDLTKEEIAIVEGKA